MKIFAAMIVILGILGAAAFWFMSRPPEPEPEYFVKISGSIVDPLGSGSVSGVDLTVGDTSIRTSASGNFVFPSVSSYTGIRMTHPELLRAVVKLPAVPEGEEETVSLFFSPALYNALITVIDREARGNPDKVYELLADEIQDVITKEEYQELFEPFFTEADIAAQEVVMREIVNATDFVSEVIEQRFDVIAFEVVRDNDVKTYRFVHAGEGDGVWKLVL